MHIEILLLIIGIPAVAIWFWIQAPKVYDDHLKMKENNPIMFRMVGYNEKYLKDRASWIRRLRIYLILMTGLMFSLLIFILF
jgi:hypothetical protein